jgi:uncharacterized integral membrane protein
MGVGLLLAMLLGLLLMGGAGLYQVWRRLSRRF